MFLTKEDYKIIDEKLTITNKISLSHIGDHGFEYINVTIDSHNNFSEISRAHDK